MFTKIGGMKTGRYLYKYRIMREIGERKDCMQINAYNSQIFPRRIESWMPFLERYVKRR